MHLGQFLRQLTRLAEEFGIAVVITNQVCAARCVVFATLSCTVKVRVVDFCLSAFLQRTVQLSGRYIDAQVVLLHAVQ
jgi:RecA/RadA recombinase